MATSRPFAYNTGSAIAGAMQTGSLAIGTASIAWQDIQPGGVQWWNGPDEDLGYVIAFPVPSGDVPTPTNISASIRFKRSTAKTDNSFINLVNTQYNQNFTTTLQCYSYITSSQFYTSYPNPTNNDGFNYTNFASTTGLTLVSTDGVSNNWLYITNTNGGNIGNVYRSTAIKYNRSFSVEWLFNCSGGTGADGFCLQWTTTNNTNGAAGGGVGYIDNASTINAFQFKTYINNSVTWLESNVVQSTTSVSAGFFRQDVYFWLDYDHATSTGYLYYSTSSTKPGSPSITLNSFAFDTGDYYIGFGAATGGSTDNHILKSWELTFT